MVTIIQYCVLETNRDDHYRVMQIDRSDVITVPIISNEIAVIRDKQLAINLVAILNAWESEAGKTKSLDDIMNFIRGIDQMEG